MSESATLISHKGDTDRVSYNELCAMPAPPSTRHWRPVSHKELVDTLTQELADRGFSVAKSDFAIGSNGLKLFGTFDLDKEMFPGISTAVGFRHSNDKKIALQIVGGARVFVCDNMAFSGDATILRHKHTWGFSLRSTINHGLDAWQGKQIRMMGDMHRLAHAPIQDTEARNVMAKMLYDGITTFQTFKIAYDMFFEKATRRPEEYSDCAPRTLWGLHNAYTRALKESTPNVQFSNTIALSKVFGLGTESTYALAS